MESITMNEAKERDVFNNPKISTHLPTSTNYVQIIKADGSFEYFLLLDE